jgi:SAM-dependent methyltransferase
MTSLKRDLPTRWTEEQVRQFVEREHLAYQRIELPYGYYTGGEDRSATATQIFPADMTGKTVLDIGSLNGYFCFEALRRGAKAAVGIEVSAESARKSIMIADCLGLPAEFRLADIETDPVEGPFDYVLCLNVLHHLKNPLAALEKLTALTRERLVLEVASIGRRDRRKLGISFLSSFLLRRAPVLYVANLEQYRGAQKFFITPGAIKSLLMSHRKSFASMDLLPSEHKDRFIAVARRRQIGRLIVVAGPSSAGKSTLIQRLLAGELPELAGALGMKDNAAWKTVTSGSLAHLNTPRTGNLLFHYDFIRALSKSSKTYERDEAFDILECAEEVTFLTLWTPPEVLRQQLEQSEILPHMKKGVFRGNQRHLRLRAQYEDRQAVIRFYRDWIEFCRTKPGRHLVVQLARDVKCYQPEEWEREVAAKVAPGNA